MTKEQREKISEVIGYLWGLIEHDSSLCIAQAYADDLIEMLEKDKGSRPQPTYGKAVEDKED